MPFSQTQSRPTSTWLSVLAAASVIVVILGWAGNYSFLPDQGVDGFVSQIAFSRDLLASGDWASFTQTPLSLVHLIRFCVVWPFLAAESILGPPGSLSLILAALWPLILVFRPQRGDWRDVAFVAVRFLVLFLPLFVSGRTMLVIAAMGYLVSGTMMRPFSAPRMLAGAVLAVLSSASILFSIAILAFAGNWNDRSRAFYVAKLATIALVAAVFVPSLFAKVEGFAAGTVGYAYEHERNGTDHVVVFAESDKLVSAESDKLVSAESDKLGSGPIAAFQRLIVRSTVVESYLSGNFARVALYLGIIAMSIGYIAWSLLTRHRHPMVLVLSILSFGIFLEGLALWPIVFPIMWAYTGIVKTNRVALVSSGPNAVT